jgi:hypothetical protein
MEGSVPYEQLNTLLIMKKRCFNFIFLLCFTLFISSCNNKGNSPAAKIDFINHAAEKRLDVMIDGKLFTSFCWPDSIFKPILYPVLTSEGNAVTRGFPLEPRTGERNDHIHHAGVWLSYGDVNGTDLWKNSYSNIKEPGKGVIRHIKIERLSSSSGEGYFISAEKWLGPAGYRILDERSEYHFTARGPVRIIDRITTLTAGDTAVLFKDTKEGFFAVRVAKQLELPSDEGVTLIDSTGKPLGGKDTLNTSASGNYLSSEGLSGESVWGTRARWMSLTGIIGAEPVSVVICDHPKNPGYPTFWMARGYGLFAANPLGWHDFTNGEKNFDFTIQPGKSATFRYRLIVNSGSFLTPAEINRYADEFSKKYK